MTSRSQLNFFSHRSENQPQRRRRSKSVHGGSIVISQATVWTKVAIQCQTWVTCGCRNVGRYRRSKRLIASFLNLWTSRQLLSHLLAQKNGHSFSVSSFSTGFWTLVPLVFMLLRRLFITTNNSNPILTNACITRGGRSSARSFWLQEKSCQKAAQQTAFSECV
jgi:hypothetical protein